MEAGVVVAIIFEMAMSFIVIYGIMHEDAWIRFERALCKKIKRYFKMKKAQKIRSKNYNLKVVKYK